MLYVAFRGINSCEFYGCLVVAPGHAGVSYLAPTTHNRARRVFAMVCYPRPVAHPEQIVNPETPKIKMLLLSNIAKKDNDLFKMTTTGNRKLRQQTQFLT